MNKDEALQKVINWGENNNCIKALILTGSLAGKGKVDELSDLDIAVFGTDFTFIQNDDWLSHIDNVWVCIHDQFSFEDHIIPTRLTIFNEGLKIDFSFHPVELLGKLAERKDLPESYKNGYKILLDKTGVANKLAQPGYNAYLLLRPDLKSFQNNENEFWFECYHVARYLKRGDLWTAKVRDKDVKKNLLEMLQWHHVARHNNNFNPRPYGREMHNWLEESLWGRLYGCYSGFDKESSRVALNNTISLYREVTKQVAVHFHFEYNEMLDTHLSSFTEHL